MDSGTIWGSSEKGLRADQEGEEATEDGMALNGEGIGVKGADAVQLLKRGWCGPIIWSDTINWSLIYCSVDTDLARLQRGKKGKGKGAQKKGKCCRFFLFSETPVW